MSRLDLTRQRFPNSDAAGDYQLSRSPRILIGIVVAAAMMMILLWVYAAVRHPLLFVAAGIAAGTAFALWYITKAPPEE